jgi:hypothetical protein
VNPATTGITPQTCPQCGAAGTTRFCGECGHPLSAAPSGDLRALVREGAAEVLGLDRRLVATGRDLLLHPARVVKAHLAGRGNAYVHPLKLFFFLGGLYMLCLAWLLPFSFDAIAADRNSLTRFVYGATNAAELRRVFAKRGLTAEVANARFQERSNTATPLVTALALVPLALILRLLQRDRPLRDHITFLLVISNAVWLVSFLTLPLLLLNETAAVIATMVGMYLYLGIGFFAVYPARTRSRTAVRFAAFAVSDLVITSLVSALLSAAILASLFYP